MTNNLLSNTDKIIQKANQIYSSNFKHVTQFERALFLSWYCSKGDCKFCYMSTQKSLIKNPKKSRRSFESIFAEAIISKACDWDIEFLSGGYDSFEISELLYIAKNVSIITNKKQWLNIGTLTYDELTLFKPYIKGYVGTLECVNPKLRKNICPSKPLAEIKNTFDACDKLGLKKAITIIIGLGETISDFPYLSNFIKDNGVEKITFYSLNPQKGTCFTKSPEIDYYEEWIAKTRIKFPTISIIAGAWHNKLEYYSRLLIAGANNITKFPVLKYFRTKKATELENQIKLANRKLIGTFTKMPKIAIDSEISKLDTSNIDIDKLTLKIKQYLNKIKE